MALDPDASALLDAMANAMAPVETMTPTEARAASRKLAALLPTTELVSAVADHAVPVDGGEIRVRTYHPAGVDDAPAFLYVHGGGWVIGGELEMFDPLCDQIATEARCVVASVGYRLAPEHPFPVPLDDCAAAAGWIVDCAAALGVDPSRVAVGGDSSGGNLAAAVALRSRDRGGPPFLFQLLVYPPTRCTRDASRYAEGLDVAVLTRAGMAWYWNHYVPAGMDRDPYVSPLLASDLTGLPPALVMTAGHDVLAEEGRAYARRLQEASVPVEVHHYDDMFHGFFGFSSALARSRQAIATAIAALRRALHGTNGEGSTG